MECVSIINHLTSKQLIACQVDYNSWLQNCWTLKWHFPYQKWPIFLWIWLILVEIDLFLIKMKNSGKNGLFLLIWKILVEIDPFLMNMKTISAKNDPVFMNMKNFDWNWPIFWREYPCLWISTVMIWLQWMFWNWIQSFIPIVPPSTNSIELNIEFRTSTGTKQDVPV